MTLLIHVDDVLYLGEEEYVMNDFLPSIKARFEISEQHLAGPGSSFQFLRRTYEETETGLKVHPGKYAGNMVEMYEETMGRAKIQSLPCSQEMLEADGTTQLRPDLASLYRSLVGCGIYFSQERPDVPYVIKELAGSMSCPTTGSLRKLGKLVGYLKNTMGQYTMLEIEEPGAGLSTKTTKGRRLLETFSDSDWSGSKSHRRSTSAAIHVANGVVVFASSRGQKSVTLSSAEAELNALVSAAADGIYLRKCLEFIAEEKVIHHCLVDNSAALHLCHRKGPGKLRHISGKLLWIQDLVAQEELQARAVGTVYNIADLGTKPLTKNRISLILHWCNARRRDGERLGQEEHGRLQEMSVSQVKISKLAKLLNRILLLEDLEQVAGVREIEPVENGKWWWWWFFIVMIVAVLIFSMMVMVAMMWKRIKALETVIQQMKDDSHVDVMTQGAMTYEVEEKVKEVGKEVKELKVYAQQIHRGLVKASGYVDATEFHEEDWKHWNYLQHSNREFDLRRMDAQVKEYLKAKQERDEELDEQQIPLGSPSPQREETENDDDDIIEGEETVQVRLDSGEVVEIPLRFIEPREPESEEDVEMTNAPEAPQETAPEEEVLSGTAQMPESREDPTISKATSGWISGVELRRLAVFDKAAARSCLRAKQHLMKCEQEWWKANQNDDHERKYDVYGEMDKRYEFLDCGDLPF